MKTAIIYITHLMNDSVKEEINKLSCLSMSGVELYIAYDIDKCRFLIPDAVRDYQFSYKTINEHGLGTWGCTLLDGNMHHIFLDFFNQNHDYDYYWFMEYDVRFAGNWKDFFSFFELNNADFISSHIEYQEDAPSWTRWNEISLINISDEEIHLVKSFNPICRLSNKMLRMLQERSLLGDKGHYEVLLPTLANKFKLKLFDIGGVGTFSSKTTPNLFYTEYVNENKIVTCTHRYRPSYSSDSLSIKDMIYHPIK